jgi:hypothetical protein
MSLRGVDQEGMTQIDRAGRAGRQCFRRIGPAIVNDTGSNWHPVEEVRASLTFAFPMSIFKREQTPLKQGTDHVDN